MFRDHFSERATDYASRRPGYPAALADWLAGQAPGRERAWDAGCGSGQLSALLAGCFAAVVATDASGAQLAHARAHPLVDYCGATAEASPLRSCSIDLAVAAQAAHWFDLTAYWAEVRRVARPRAIVALVTYALAEVAPAIDERVVRFYRDDLGRYWPAERRMVEDGYRSLPFPFDEIEAPDFRMSERWTAADFVGYVGTWSAVRGLERDGGAARLEAFATDVRTLWGDTRRAVRWPLSLRVGRVPG